MSAIEVDYEEDERDFWEDDQRSRDRDDFVLDCGDPHCLMPGPHFLSECHTVEMLEDWQRQFKPTPRLRRKRRRRQ